MKLIKVGSSQGCLGKNEGTELAPDKIVNSLKEIYSNEDGYEVNFEIDVVDIDKNNIEKTNKNIFEKVKSLNSKAILLGGDHSITYAAFKAFSSNHKIPGLIMFDAHPDCVNEFNPPSHEDFIRTLIKEKILKPENLIIIGLRNCDKSETEFLKENRIKFYTVKQVFEDKETICDAIMELARKFDSFYLSIDIDAVDPAFAPGTGYIEPAGLSSRELIYFLQRIKRLKNLGLIDVVEVNPEKDFNNLTVKLAAKIIYEIS